MEESNSDRCVRDYIRCMYIEDSFIQEEFNNAPADENRGVFSKLFKK